MELIRRLTRSSKIHADIGERFRRYLCGGRILDAPAGKGENVPSLLASGFEVRGADLFPEVCAADVPVDKVNLTEPLPYGDSSFEGVLCSEGIEHLDAQVTLLQELARVLKPGGVLIVTTPNLLHFEGRLGTMLTGHAYRNRSIVVETAAYWGGAEHASDERTYFGHVFLIDAFQLRFYLTHAGLEVVAMDTTRYSWKSLLLAPLLYPFVWWATRSLLRNPRSRIPRKLQAQIRSQVLSAPVLFGRKLVVTARKPVP